MTDDTKTTLRKKLMNLRKAELLDLAVEAIDVVEVLGEVADHAQAKRFTRAWRSARRMPVELNEIREQLRLYTAD